MEMGASAPSGLTGLSVPIFFACPGRQKRISTLSLARFRVGDRPFFEENIYWPDAGSPEQRIRQPFLVLFCRKKFFSQKFKQICKHLINGLDEVIK
jgi:hypothetical protein